MQILRISLSIIAGVSLLGGCDIFQSGETGTLNFKLDTDDRLIPATFGTPIAAGMSVDVLAFVGTGEDRMDASLTLAQSLDQTVARVTGQVDNRISIAALSAGTFQLEVFAAAGNDRVEMSVADIAKATLSYPGVLLSPSTPPVNVALGGTARFGVRLADAAGKGLIGYGDFPITVAPADAATALTSSDVAHVAVRFDALGDVTLTPRGDDAVTVTVIPVADVVNLDLDVFVDQPVAVGGSTVATLRGETAAGEVVVGLADSAVVTAAPAATCRVEAAPLLGDAVYTVWGIAAGSCTVSAVFNGVTATADLTVQ